MKRDSSAIILLYMNNLPVVNSRNAMRIALLTTAFFSLVFLEYPGITPLPGEPCRMAEYLIPKAPLPRFPGIPVKSPLSGGLTIYILLL